MNVTLCTPHPGPPLQVQPTSPRRAGTLPKAWHSVFRTSQFTIRNSHLAPRTPDVCSGQPAERGIALIMVMIAIFVLTVLAGGFAYSMKIETKLARNANSEAELEWLGRSGVEYARWVLALSAMDPTKPFDSLDQPWATGFGIIGPTNNPLAQVENPIHLPNGSFTWKITDLESRFNINSADEGTLQRALMAMGVDAGEQTSIANCILDWIDTDDLVRPQGAESESYQSSKPSYVAKNGPIDDLSELLLINGITMDLYAGGAATNYMPGLVQPHADRFGSSQTPAGYNSGLTNFFSALSSGKLNINSASAAVLQVLPGVTPNIAEAIVAGRQGDSSGMGMTLTGPYRSVQEVTRCPEVPFALPGMLAQFCDVRSRTFQVEVEADVAGYKRQFVAILGRNNPRDVQVLTFYWK